MPPDHHESPSSSSHWIVSLKSVAIAASVFGISCLVVLVISTAVDNADALSTVALALAILAFTVQLIVFVAQDAAAREQGWRNEELHALMRGLLAEIKEKAAGTQADVRTINDKLLEGLLAKSLPDAQSAPGGIDYRRLATELSSSLEQAAPAETSVPPQSGPASTLPYPPRRPTPDDQRICQQMATFPGQQELGDSMEVLKSLSENSRFRLLQFGEDEIRSRSPGSTYDPALSDLLSGELIAHGLVEPVKGYFTSIDNSPLLHLTQRGREVARLLTAEGDVPDYLGDLEEIRLALADAAEGPLASES